MKGSLLENEQQETTNPEQEQPSAPEPSTEPAVQSLSKKQVFRFDRLYLFFWFFCSFVFCESILRVLTDPPFFGVGFIFILLFGAAAALLLAALCSLLPRLPSLILALVFMGLMEIIYTVQMFYYFMFKTFFTVFSMFNGGDALQFGGNIWGTLANTWMWVALMLAPIILFAIFGRKAPRESSWKASAILAAAAVGLHFLTVALLPAFGNSFFTPYDYYYNNQSINQSVDKLGLLTTFRLDAKRYLFGMEEASAEPSVVETTAELPSVAPTPVPTPQSVTSALADEKAAATQTPEPEYGYNVLDIDFVKLAESTDDPTLKEMDLYFGNVAPTRQNDHTGMFEGYNLITITAESFAPYAIDKELTPTLYKMANNGFVFTDFYCPEWPVSTSDGEYVNCLGLIPKPGVWSLYLSGKWEHSLPFALGNQFREQGYNTFAYHNNSYTYYDRHISHPNMGYEYKGLGNGLEVDKTWPESDLQMIDVTTDELISNQPFHAYYVTVSGHMIYSWGGNDMSTKHQVEVESLGLSEPAAAYIACNMEMDRAMELLLQRLEEAGIADKTLIVISADHPPYGLEKDEVSELIGHDVENTFEYNQNTLIMYCEGMESETIDKPMCSLDILPTVSNLFGLPYDSRLLAGKDIFSDSAPLAILGDRSWVSDIARFNSNTGEVIPVDGNVVDPAYVDAVNQDVANKFSYSKLIFEQDYYAHVLGSNNAEIEAED